MSKLIKQDINDIKNRPGRDGLVSNTFEDQLDLLKYPAIYVDISASSIEYLEYDSGILRIYNTWEDYNEYNLFSKTLIQLCEIIETNIAGSSAKLISANVAMLSCLLISRFSSRNIMNVQIDKSPLLLTDFHPDTLENICSIESDNPSYSVLDVKDENNKSVDYSVSPKYNLFVNQLGEAIVQYDLKRFFFLIREENLVTTKFLLNHALTYEIEWAEKNLLVEQFLETHNIFHG